MKQILQNFKTGKIELTDIPMPAVKQGFVLVKNHYSLISPGTERAVIELAQKNLISKARARPDELKQVFNKIKTDGLITTFKRAAKKLDEPMPLGYSSAGQVIKIGQGIEEFQEGDLVACAGGGYAYHAEVVVVPKNLCVKIPDSVSYKQAVFTTLGSIAMQGIRRANLTPGEKVAVIGLGLIGQLTCQILKAYGFSVISADKEGFPKEVENTVDAVIITAATKSNEPIELAGRILRDKGRVSVVGDVKMDIPRRVYYKKELDLFISRSYGPGRYDKNYEEKGHDYPISYVRWTENRNMQEFLRLASRKLIQPEKLITHVFDINQAQKAYELITKNINKERIVAVLFSYDAQKKQKDILKFSETKKYSKNTGIINIGLIGAGNFTQAIVLPVLKKIKNIHLRAVADTQGINSQKIVREFRGNYATTNWQKIIKDKKIDLVIITTRHNLHAQMVIEALKHNKNIHVEKPLCLNQKELKEIIKTAQKSKGRLMVGFNRRFAPLGLKAKELFQGGEPLNILYRINAESIPKDHWLYDPKIGGGRIIGEACHFIDFCQFIAGSPVKKVYASGKQDNLIINIDFHNNSHGVILYTASGPALLSKEYIEIIGNNKAMSINNFKSGIFYSNNRKKRFYKFNQDKGHFAEFKNFIQAIRVGNPSPISLKEIVSTTQSCFDVIKSIQNEYKITN